MLRKAFLFALVLGLVSAPIASAVIPPSAGGGPPLTMGGGGGSGGGGGAPVAASASPRISLGLTGLPWHGDSLTESDPNYDPAKNLLTIGGKVRGLPALGAYTILVQGAPVTATAVVGSVIEFTADIDLDTKQGPKVPYSSWLDDPNRPLIGVLAELVDPLGFVVSRDRIVLYDARFDTRIKPKTPTGLEVPGTAVVLSPSGLDALSSVHLANLFFPSFDDFQDDLASVVELETKETHEFANENCFDLELLHPLTSSVTYASLLAEAVAYYAMYEGLRTNPLQYCGTLTDPLLVAACSIVVVAGVETMCVKALPGPADFEACVSAVGLTMTSATVDSVDEVELSYGQQATIHSVPTLHGVDTTFTGELDQISIRWKKGSCTLRPSAELTEGDYESEDVDAWRTCDDLEIDSPDADPVSTMDYQLTAVGEAVDVDFSGGSFQISPEYDLGFQTCFEDWVAPSVQDALEKHDDDVEQVLSAAWHLDTPSDEATALDLLLAPFDLGLRTTLLYDSKIEWEELDTDPLDGLWLAATTDATSKDARALEPTTWFRYEEASPPEWLALGIDQDGQPFDVAYTVSTGHLNQVLRASYGGTLAFSRPLRVTAGDLGAVVDPDRIVNLTGTLLAAQVDPLFAVIGNQKVTFRIRGSLSPFTMMEVDPLGVPVGDFKVSFNAPAFTVTMRSGRKTWARFIVDLHEPEILFSNDAASQSMTMGLDLPQISWISTDWGLSTCKREPFPASIASGTGCEADAIEALAEVLNPIIERELQALATGIPAPVLFDAEGTSTTSLEEVPNATGIWTEDQMVTFLGILE